MMMVEVETKPTFKLGKSKILFNLQDMGRRNVSDISPDGKRFLMLKNVETAEDESRVEEPTFAPPRKISIVVNWFEELKIRVPVHVQ